MTMQTAKDNNMIWLALVIGGGILAYSTLRKDVVAITDNVVDGTKYVLDKANPLSQKNVVNSVISATGQAISQNKDWELGTAIHNALDKTNPEKGRSYLTAPAKKVGDAWKKQINDKWVALLATDSLGKVKGKTVAVIDTYGLVNGYQFTNGGATVFVKMAAKEISGKWQKQINNQWFPIGARDKVHTSNGNYVLMEFLA